MKLIITFALMTAVTAALVLEDYLPGKDGQLENVDVDGYKYKTVRKLKQKIRRDVSELSAYKYLPPVQSDPGMEYSVPVNQTSPTLEYLSPEKGVKAEQDTSVLTPNGYEYKTVHRLKFRQRRDVSEIDAIPKYLPPSDNKFPPGEYLPPVKEEIPSSDNESLVGGIEAEQDTAILSDDGYQYKTIRRLKYRHRRDVSEIVPNQGYLPPVETTLPPTLLEPPVETIPVLNYLPPVEYPNIAAEPEQDTAVLADDGYQYKQVKQIRYRHRV